jgi:hypothetical protein
VDHRNRTALATEAVKVWEFKVLDEASAVTSCNSAAEQAIAVRAQTSLAQYVKAVDNAGEAIKKPLNEIRSKVIALNKELVAAADQQGQRIGSLIADFQICEQNRVAALRRLQDQQATILEQEQDKRLAEANSVAEQDQIRDEFRAELAAQAPPVEPIRAPGQVVKQQWSVEVTDIHTLYRCHPNCCSLKPLLNEIKFLLDQGISVKGVRAEKVTVASVRLAPQPAAITI